MTKKNTWSAFKAIALHKYVLYFVFWSFNIFYTIIFGFISTVAIPLFFLEENAVIPWNIAILFYLLLLVPLGISLLGLTTKLKKHPRKLVALMFGIEVPVVFLALIRLFAIRQMTPILWFFFISLFIAMTGLLLYHIRKRTKSVLEKALLIASQEIALINAVYFCTLFLFFLPIIVAGIFYALGPVSITDLWEFIVDTRGIGLFSTFSILFWLASIGTIFLCIIAMPLIAVVVYWRSFKKLHIKLSEEIGTLKAGLLQFGFGSLYIAAAILLALQWHSTSSATLTGNYLEAQTFSEQQEMANAILSNEKVIRSDFLNEYLAPYRYFTDETAEALFIGYKNELNLSEETSTQIQSAFNLIALPFVYQGNFADENEVVREQYSQLFDAPIQDGEKEALKKALAATNTDDPLRAGILDADEETVQLVSREITAFTQDDINTSIVTVEDEYNNTSRDVQEVYYEFSLPTDAVVTGLWLGPNLEEIGVIAPKGAAREVYEDQLVVRQDPALLEKIGPRQYRLRVFPIQTFENQRVKFEYTTLNDPGSVPLPVFSKIRNLYENDETKHRLAINGEAVSDFSYSKTNHCNAEPFTIETAIGPVSYIPHAKNDAIGSQYTCGTSEVSLDTLTDTKIALLLDVSGSTEERNWTSYLNDQLSLDSLSPSVSIDGYFFNEFVSDPIRITSETSDNELSATHFGTTDRVAALEAIPNDYDAIIMFTDDSDFDGLDANDADLLTQEAPIYIVHDGAIPQYQDGLTRTIARNGGGAFQNGSDALQQLAARRLVSSDTLLSVSQAGSWVLADGHNNPVEQTDDSLGQSKAIASLTSKEVLDYRTMHGIAQQYEIASLYSSYIALVTDFQKQQLEEESAQSDAFAADYDAGIEEVSNPSTDTALEVGAVPEPEEWALIIAAILVLGYYYREHILSFVTRR